MALTSRFRLEVLAQLTGVAEFGATPTADLPVRKETVLTSGTGTGQADKIWYDKGRNISASATDSLDLAGGLTDAFGAALTFAKLKGIAVFAADTNGGNINLTRPASNGVPLFSAAGDAMPIVPGGWAVWVAPNAGGITVTAGTGDLIDLVNSVASQVTYDIVLLGTSA